jgi:hypothetical protein
MRKTILQQVRDSCKSVAENASLVHIARECIPSYAASLPHQMISKPSIDPGCHYMGHGNDTVAFFLTLNTINFGSGYFPHIRKRNGMSGYFTVASSLNDHFRNHGPLSVSQLQDLTVDDCCIIFSQDMKTEPVRELMQLFTVALNDLGRYVQECFAGSFLNLVEASGFSTERLVKLLVEMPFFNDVASYRDFPVMFFKRAQITAADLFLAFAGAGPGRFNDIDCLTIFADNLVPHVLRIDGILCYDKELALRIEKEEEIPAGSPEEIEIRACAVHAAELLIVELQRLGHRVNAMELDQYLWNRGQKQEFKSSPRHRTRSIFY